MQVAILGPIEVRDGDRVVPVAGTRLRRLLLRLTVDVGRVVSAQELVDAIWGEELPSDVTGALQTLVSRLRRTLGDPALVEQVVGGYRLTLDRSAVDVHQFSALAGEGQRALSGNDAQGAAANLRAALGLWRGEALLDAGDAEYGAALASRYEAQRLDVVSGRIEADLQLGDATGVVSELRELVATHPLHERSTAQLMRALVATGRAAEALTAYEQFRRTLSDQLGTDPSSSLQEQHLQILRGAQAAEAPVRARRQAHRTNLRSALTSFIGRDDDAKRVSGLIESGRLTTIVGPGGAGKTRLAAEVGNTWIERLEGGVWFVPLAPVTDEHDIAPTILAALGMRENKLLERQPERMTRDAMGRLLEALGDATCLLVVDNCEHLVDGVAEVVDKVLTTCPRVRVLATSREPLGIDGESLCGLTSLPLPPQGVNAVQALSYPSVQLLAERAAAADDGFAVDDTMVGACIEIVRRLDGLPLAIELAAARLRVLPVDEIAARLSDRFALLTGGKRTALPRHRTLRAVVQWSWDLLTDEERLLAERLSVFPAGASVESARVVCAGGGLPARRIPDLLSALVDKSLLEVAMDGELRYRMLETIREFGSEQLVGREEMEAVRRSHARHFAGLVHEADPRLRTREQLPWLARLRRDRDNILAALRFLGECGDAPATLAMALELTWYWTLTGSQGEAVTWLGYALAVPGDVDPDQRTAAEAVLAISNLAHWEEGDDPPASAEDVAAELAGLNARLDKLDLERFPMVAVMRPMLAFFSGEEDQVQAYFDEAIAGGDAWIRAMARMFMASIAENEGDPEGMRANLAEALHGFSKIGDRWGLAQAVGVRARLRLMDGDLDGAQADYQRTLDYSTELGSSDDVELVRIRMLDVHVRRGELDLVRQEAAALREEAPDLGSAERLLLYVVLAGIARIAGDDAELHRLLRESARLLDDLGPRSPMRGHAHALFLAVCAGAELDDGRLEEAEVQLARAYDLAVATRDKPIISVVGVGIAELLITRERPAEAAEVLGASAQLRGGDDLTDVAVKRVRRVLGDALGDRFDPAYAKGRMLPRDAALARLAPARWADPDRAS